MSNPLLPMGSDIFFTIVWGGLLLLFVVWLVAIVVAIVKTVGDESIGGVLKLLWVIALFAFPFLGLLVWIFFREQINRSISQSA